MQEKENYKTLIERRCSRCGRIFVPAPYRIYQQHGRVFCSWSCYNSFLNEREQSKRTRSSRTERGSK